MSALFGFLSGFFLAASLASMAYRRERRVGPALTSASVFSLQAYPPSAWTFCAPNTLPVPVRLEPPEPPRALLHHGGAVHPGPPRKTFAEEAFERFMERTLDEGRRREAARMVENTEREPVRSFRIHEREGFIPPPPSPAYVKIVPR